MRTGTTDQGPVEQAAPAIVQVASQLAPVPDSGAPGQAGASGDDAAALAKAQAFARPLLDGHALDTGEDAWGHAQGVASILRGIGASDGLVSAAYLVYAAETLSRPEETVRKMFGESSAQLVQATRRLVEVQRQARGASVRAEQQGEQLERVRKMLLAFSRDLRVVLLRLASRLQTLRHHMAARNQVPQSLAQESLQVFAPLANRLGIWQIKWELEDLSFRCLEPQAYTHIARLLDEKRLEREQGIERSRADLMALLQRHGLQAQVQGRPKHLYSIWLKMQGKQLDFNRVFDLRALRLITPDVADCYAALSLVHEHYQPVAGEFDDYIAKPKANGYQSLHTVVRDRHGRTLEIQIRTHAMHEHAEHGVAAHWAYKEAGPRGYGGVSAAGSFENSVAQARKAVLRQLLAWERDLAGRPAQDAAAPTEDLAGQAALFQDRVFVFTPQATIVELPFGATPVDFAYSVHTDLGHRCRGARVDGQLVPLHTVLQSGQTVEVIANKEGGPSLDWLNPELHFLVSARAKAKVRAWFNHRAQQETIQRGREAVARLLQREGRTAMNLDDLAGRLGFNQADALFEVVGKDEYSLRNIETLLRPPAPLPDPDESIAQRRAPDKTPSSGVLVVGVESLLTQLARCCRPAPPDEIAGFVTRGKGVSVHRATCLNFEQMARSHPQRVLPVAWAHQGAGGTAYFPVDVHVESVDRHGLLRDVSDVFAREKVNVIGVHTQSGKGLASMIFTVEINATDRLAPVLRQVEKVPGVRRARRL